MDRAAMLVLSHAGLGFLALLAAGLPPAARGRAVRVAATAGVVAAAALYAIEDQWRTIDLSRPGARVAAVGAAAAWLLVLVVDRGRGAWRSAALVGCAATGLLLAAAGRWLVPMVIFWVASTVAIVLLLRDARAPSLAYLSIVAGDALIVAGLIEFAQTSQTWLRPEGLEGWPMWAAAVGTILRSGAVPLTGIWGALDTPSAPALPLVVAGASTIALPSLTAVPWVSVVLLAVCLALALWSLSHRNLQIGIVAAWPVAFALATAFAASRAEATAGVQAALACGAVCLWPLTSGRAQVERGLLISFVPPTAGFAAVTIAASASFESASRISGVVDLLPWAIAVGMLPVALLAGVLLGARAGAGAEEETFEPSAVLAMWALVVVSILLWLYPPHLGQISTRATLLQLGALAAALAAAWLARGTKARNARIQSDPVGSYGRALLEPRARLARALSLVSLLVGCATVGMVAWFTIDGLRLGFLPG